MKQRIDAVQREIARRRVSVNATQPESWTHLPDEAVRYEIGVMEAVLKHLEASVKVATEAGYAGPCPTCGQAVPDA